MNLRASLPVLQRPITRGDCIDGPRPCPWATCRYHLLVNVAEDGRLFRARDFDEHSAEEIADTLEAMRDTCALDVADRGEHTFEEVGELMGVTLKGVESAYTLAMSQARRSSPFHDHPDDPYFDIMSRAKQGIRRS